MKKKTSKALYRNPKIETRKSGIHGFGIFANKRIKAGEIIEECPYIVFPQPWEKTPQTIQNYVFFHGRKYKPNESVIAFGCASVFNHSDDNSAKWYVDKKKKVFRFVALKNIKSDEEIFVHYGDDYWENKNNKK